MVLLLGVRRLSFSDYVHINNCRYYWLQLLKATGNVITSSVHLLHSCFQVFPEELPFADMKLKM